MDGIVEQFKSMGSYGYFLIGFFVIMIAYYIGMTIYSKKSTENKRAKAKAWLDQHPDAAKIYIEQPKRIGRTDQFKILSVDDEAPLLIKDENKKWVFYVLPGERVLELKFFTQRPGDMYKTVSKTYGPTKQQITAEPNQNYAIFFDTKEKSFSFKRKTEI